VTTTLDRMVLLAYFRSYAIVVTSLLSLYVVIDLFTNLDTFGKTGGGVSGVIEHVAAYYGYQITLIFDRMAEAITLLAAVFTVSWMQRNNELLPQLSAGIPTRRVIRPILIGSAITLSLGPLNQELVIPRIADKLLLPKDDYEGGKAQPVMGAFDRDGLHIEGVAAFRRERRVKYLYITFPDSAASGMFHMVAQEAVYIPPGNGPMTGGWLLTQATPETPEAARIPADRLPANLTLLDPGRYFLRTEDIDFDTVCRGGGWFMYAPTRKLEELLARPEPRRQSKVAVMFHMRLTRPLIGGLLVFLGLSVILRNPNRHVFISAGLCLVFTAVFYAFALGCKFLGDADYVAAPLAAWLPVLIFGPITFVSFDAIHT
jgi:lipopolysaccharide export system permease protein